MAGAGKGKKLVAPAVVSGILMMWFLFYLTMILGIPEIPLLFRVFGALVTLALIGVSIFVLVERIKEIGSGEEDDLSKY